MFFLRWKFAVPACNRRNYGLRQVALADQTSFAHECVTRGPSVEQTDCVDAQLVFVNGAGKSSTIDATKCHGRALCYFATQRQMTL